jgi:Holliday junction resolvase RusA-like endonuclease
MKKVMSDNGNILQQSVYITAVCRGGQMNSPIIFMVSGEPVPKQSTRFDGRGRAHTDQRIAVWQACVGWQARETMRAFPPLTGPVSVRIVFSLGNARRVDLDNLSKAILDAINGIVIKDDRQVVNLHLMKYIRKTPGVIVEVYPGNYLPPFAGDNGWTNPT